MLPPLTKAVLGGLDRRQLMARLAEEGPKVAAADFARDRERLAPRTISLPRDEVVLVLGGSNGLGRALVMQLLFAERANVFALHNDSEKLQVGTHHVRAIREAAAFEGLQSAFMNDDATNPKVVADVITALRAIYKRVHVFNSIAAGAPKRYAEHGPTQVPDIEVAFDPIRQVADFSQADNAKAIGLVDVDVASQADIDKTNRLMGTSTELWVKALLDARVLDEQSVIAFADYDFEPDNPVYGMGPLAGAKKVQRECIDQMNARGLHAVRVCYPAMNTTAITVIPGGMLMYAATAHALREKRQTLQSLAAQTMPIFRRDFKDKELRLDTDYQRVLGELKPVLETLDENNWRAHIAGAFAER
jgi:enoyl-[acyl-carrier protein] reductase / trans-2-enoyl-CoA reductase (NAD+)